MPDTKTSALPPAAALTGAEVLPGVQAGANVKMTAASIAALGVSAPAVSVTYTASTIAALTDAGKFVRMNVGTANTFTVPPNATVAFAADVEIHVLQDGVGATTLVQGAGVTLNKPASQSLVLKEQASVVTLKRHPTLPDTWSVFGHLT